MRRSLALSSAKDRTALLLLGMFAAAIIVNILPLATVDIERNVFRCLTPGLGDEYSCVFEEGWTAGRIEEGAELGSLFGTRARFAPYSVLREVAPGASYAVAPHVMYVWHGSPVLLATLAGASEIVPMSRSEVSAAQLARGEILPAAFSWDATPASVKFSIRTAAAPVERMIVFHFADQVFFVDERLMPASFHKAFG